jgi:uncharacterized protein
MKQASKKIAQSTTRSGSGGDVTGISEKASGFFTDARGSHAWDHTMRVNTLCEHIGRREQADMTVLKAAALLHDIGRTLEDKANGRICHAEVGADMAQPLVSHLPLTRGQKDNILHCIRSHRFRGRHRPRTLEARVLFDADKLDAIGAVGVARAFLFAGEIGARLHNPDRRPEDTEPYSKDDTGYREYMIKLVKIKDRMMTAEGRRMAEKRHQFMQHFFEQFLAEHEGRR